jgi:CRISPR-associated protein Csy1
MQADDADLRTALSNDPDQARSWMQAFAALVREDSRPITHPLAKQLYWLADENPHDDTHYRLLQPLFASSLAHVVHADIQDARFGEDNKETRQAKRDNKPSDRLYRDYRDLVARKLGGTKPQNISQLNSERGGVNYLLASLPPAAWAPSSGPDLRKRGSVFHETRGSFFVFGDVLNLLRDLAQFLKTDPDQTKETRDRVNALVQGIAQELALFGASVRGRYQAGWTREADDSLPLYQQLWLDPGRIELPPRNDPEYPHWGEHDLAFNQAYEHGDWADEVATRFGLWLNGQLRKRSDKLVMLGEAEMRHFARQAILDVAWPIPLQRRAMAGAV